MILGAWPKIKFSNQNLKNPSMIHGCRASVQTNGRAGAANKANFERVRVDFQCRIIFTCVRA